MIERQLTLGQLVAAELIVTMVVASFAKVGKHLETTYDLLAALDKVGHLVDLPLDGTVEGVADHSAETSPAAIEARELAFGFRPGPVGLLRSLVPRRAGRHRGARGRERGPGEARSSTCCSGSVLPRPAMSPSMGWISPTWVPRRLRRRTALVRGTEVVAGTIAEKRRVRSVANSM